MSRSPALRTEEVELIERRVRGRPIGECHRARRTPRRARRSTRLGERCMWLRATRWPEKTGRTSASGRSATSLTSFARAKRSTSRIMGGSVLRGARSSEEGRGRAEPAAGRRLARPARLLGRPPGRAARHRRRRVQAPRRPEEGVPVALRRLKVKFFRGRDWRGWTAEAFIAELSGYIRWYREGRLKAFDGGGGAVYDTIAGRRARPGTAA